MATGLREAEPIRDGAMGEIPRKFEPRTTTRAPDKKQMHGKMTVDRSLANFTAKDDFIANGVNDRATDTALPVP